MKRFGVYVKCKTTGSWLEDSADTENEAVQIAKSLHAKNRRKAYFVMRDLMTVFSTDDRRT